MTYPMDRRELIQRVSALLGGTISASAVSGVLAGCTAIPFMPGSGGDPPKATFFTPEESATVLVMADQIIPRTGTPGAVEAGVPAFIDRMLAGYYGDKERKRLREGLARADKDAMAAHDRLFVELMPADQIALMQTYDSEAYGQRPAGSEPHFFRTMKELTILGFCTSEVGATKFLKYVAVPGELKSDIPYSEVGKAWAT